MFITVMYQLILIGLQFNSPEFGGIKLSIVIISQKIDRGSIVK